MVPHIVLIKGKHHRLLRASARFYVVTDRYYLLYVTVCCNTGSKEGCRVSVRIGEIVVKRDIVHALIALRKHLRLPFRKGSQIVPGASAGDKTDIRIDLFHELRGLDGKTGIFAPGLVSYLPLCIHLVAETPVFNTVRLPVTVLYTPVAVCRSASDVTVLKKLCCLLHTGSSEVHRHDRLCSDTSAISDKIVGPHQVRLNTIPRNVNRLRSRHAGTDTVFPIVPRNKISAGIPDSGNAEPAHKLSHVTPESVFIGGIMIRFVYSGIDRASYMFDKRTKQHSVRLSDYVVMVENNFCFHKSSLKITVNRALTDTVFILPYRFLIVKGRKQVLLIRIVLKKTKAAYATFVSGGEDGV